MAQRADTAIVPQKRNKRIDIGGLSVFLAFIGLGSNLGGREANLRLAAEHLRSSTGIVLQQSELYRTLPVDFESGNHFLNQVIALATPLTPEELLSATQEIEKLMGRTQKSHNGIHYDRIIDIDILRMFYIEKEHSADSRQNVKEITVNSTALTLPHPAINSRPFVYLPLQQIS